MQHILLLLPSETYRAADFIQAAAQLGTRVTVGSDRRNPIANSDEAVIELPLKNPELAADAITEYASESPLHAIVAVDDQGVITAALASDRLKLPYNSPQSVAATRNKADMRHRLAAYGVPQPAYAVLQAASDPHREAECLGYPVVVKPVSLSASQGVIRVDDPNELQPTLARVQKILHERGRPKHEALLLEQFVPGSEVAVEGLMRNGRLEVLAIFDKPDPLDGPFFEETLYVTPSRHTDAIQSEISSVTAQAAEALGLTEGAIHAELRTSSCQTSILEIAGRSIGGLCARALRFGLGVSLEQLILRHALNLPIHDLQRTDAASGVMMLPIPQAGRLVEVTGVDHAQAIEGITGVEITIAPGQLLIPLPEGNRYLGFIFARGHHPSQVEAALRAAHKQLRFSIETNCDKSATASSIT